MIGPLAAFPIREDIGRLVADAVTGEPSTAALQSVLKRHHNHAYMEGRKSPEFANLLRKQYANQPLYEVVRAGEHVEAMMSSPGWEIIMDLLTALQERAMHNQATNPPREMEKYVRAYGFIQAIPAAADAAATVVDLAQDVRVKLAEEAARPVAER